MAGRMGVLTANDVTRGSVWRAMLFATGLVAIGLLVQTTLAAAQSSSEAKSESLRLERLADAGRLWGFVKFVHPALTYRDIDWDQALVRALPAIRAAGTAEEYAAAINSMLAALNDPWTRAAVAPASDQASAQGPGPQPTTPQAMPVRTVDGVLVVDVSAIAHLDATARAGKEAALAALGDADRKLTAESADAKGIVIDMRMPPDSDDALMLFFDANLRPLVGRFLNRPLVLGTFRSRTHYGYPAHSGAPYGGYASHLMARTPGVIAGQSKTAVSAPMVVVTNELGLLMFADVIAGLKTAGVARVVEETSGERGRLQVTVTLVGKVDVQVTRAELVGRDGQPGVSADLQVTREAKDDRALAAAVRLALTPAPTTVAVAPAPFALQPVFDKAYPQMALPDADHRLLALFRLWSVARYFFPYLDLTDRPWADTLAEFLPRFEAAETTLAYQTAIAELTARLQDTHVSLINAGALEEHIGLFAPPLLVAEIEGQAVVAHVHDDAASAGIKVGDVILAVDGVPIAERRKVLERLFAASTPQAMSQLLDRAQLRGPNGRARLRVRDSTGKEREVAVVRSRPHHQIDRLPALRTAPATFGVLPSGYGYIDLERLVPAEVDAAMDAVMGAPALILDMRGYPNGTGWSLAPRLVKTPPSRPIIGARFRPPYWDAATMPVDPKAPSHFQLFFDQPLELTTKPGYQGKVVMLIDASAISQAEHTCLFVSAVTDVTFIGSPTNGANGDITTMVLPGNLIVSFTGQEVRFADGRQLQRVGVQPHITVHRTIAGVRAGRDEVLEAAIGHLRKLKL